MAASFAEGYRYVAEGIRSGVARFTITPPHPGSSALASLITGSSFASRIIIGGSEGHVVSMGLSREQVELLRDQCSALLNET
jgi:hypothetical protein